MYLPTDYQLQLNVIYYDVNSARIFFTDGFWTNYSDQLIKDYRRETGLVLNDRKKFLAKIKRALFTYYYMKLVQQKKTLDLYSAVISIFHSFSQNNLPIKVTSLDNVPIYYEDEWKLDDPQDVKLDEQDVEESTITTVSMSDILLAHESVSRREYDINKEHEDLADTFLQQFFDEKNNLERLRQDYEKGTLQHYFHQVGSVDMKVNIDNVFKLVERIYDHYDGKIGMVTIFNSISLRDVSISTEIRSERRFDLWMKTYQQYHVFRALVNYIGSDVCEYLYSSFLRKIDFTYFNGYHYVFNSFIIHDFIKRSYFRTSPYQPPRFIDLALDRQKEKSSVVFNSFVNSKTGHFQDLGTGFGTTSNKNMDIFSGKGLTNSNRPVKPISTAKLKFGQSNSSAFSLVSKGNISDSD